MKERFQEIMAEVKRKYNALMAGESFKCSNVPKTLLAKPGVYLFSEQGVPLYVGRTDNLRKRLANHLRRSHNTATFAFLLARHETGIKASYKSSGSRTDLLKSNAEFAAAFGRAIERIASMDVRVVEEGGPVTQALLEIYAAFVSEAKHSDFRNH